jgi:hypothetical protein
MMVRVAVALLTPFTLLACGVKTNVERPMAAIMQTQQQNPVNPEKDPSKPPRILGEPGGTIPPYPTGP